jgi:hypothetical protein
MELSHIPLHKWVLAGAAAARRRGTAPRAYRRAPWQHAAPRPLDLGGVEQLAAPLGRLQLGEIGLRRGEPGTLLSRLRERNGPGGLS